MARRERSRGLPASRLTTIPRYTIAVMVQGGAHGGSVAGADRDAILQRTLAMEEGKFRSRRWPGSRRPTKRIRFSMIEAVDFKDSGPKRPGRMRKTRTPHPDADARWLPAGADRMWNRKLTRGARVPATRAGRAACAGGRPPPPQNQTFFRDFSVRDRRHNPRRRHAGRRPAHRSQN